MFSNSSLILKKPNTCVCCKYLSNYSELSSSFFPVFLTFYNFHSGLGIHMRGF